MERLKTVLHVITSLDEGGAQRYLLLHCQHETRMRHVVAYLTGRGLYAAQFRRSGVEVVDLGVRGPLSAIMGLLRLRRLIARQRPKVLMAWMYHAILLAMGCLSGKPIIWNVRQTYSGRANEKRDTYRILRVLALVSSHASAIVYNSHAARQSHEALGYSARYAQVIYNGVSVGPVALADVDAFRASIIPAGDCCLIVNLGRHHAMKGQREFAMVAAEILPRHHNVFFLAVGAGMMRERQDLVRLLPDSVADRFVTQDHTTSPAVVLSAANIYLGTSLWGEAYPNSVAEAVALGCHVLATDVGDTAAILGDVGTVLSPGDVQQAVGELNELLSSGAWRQRVPMPVSDVLSLEGATAKYRALYVRSGGR